MFGSCGDEVNRKKQETLQSAELQNLYPSTNI